MGRFRDTAIRDNDPRTEVANLRVEVGVLREEVARLRAIEAAARVALASLLDVSERDRAGYPVPIEVWYAARDTARNALEDSGS